jgi:hypothetical protein
MPANDFSREIGADHRRPQHEPRDTRPAEGSATAWRVISTLRLRLGRRLAKQDTPWACAPGDTQDEVAR